MPTRLPQGADPLLKSRKELSKLATRNKHISRKSLAIALAIVGVAGLSTASAAQLTVNSGELVAGVDSITDCDADGVTVSYSPTYTASVPGYTVNAVTIGDLDGSCTGTVRVTVTDAANAALANGSIAYAAGSVTISLSATVSVASLYGVAVAIS